MNNKDAKTNIVSLLLYRMKQLYKEFLHLWRSNLDGKKTLARVITTESLQMHCEFECGFIFKKNTKNRQSKSKLPWENC